MLENLGGTVIQVTNWFENENGKTVHDAINILVAEHTHICFDRNSKEYLQGSYIRFSEPMWNILNENPVPLSREIAVNLPDLTVGASVLSAEMIASGTAT